MKTAKLKDMKLGWFVGDFEPTLYKTKDSEVAVKKYKAGDYEKAHFHKIATEITVIVSGKAKMNDSDYEEEDIIILSPGETTDFRALTDVVTVVVKIPSVKEDKYLSNKENA